MVLSSSVARVDGCCTVGVVLFSADYSSKSYLFHLLQLSQRAAGVRCHGICSLGGCWSAVRQGMVISRRKRAVLSKWTLQKKCKDILSFTRGWRTNTPAASLAASAADHMYDKTARRSWVSSRKMNHHRNRTPTFPTIISGEGEGKEVLQKVFSIGLTIAIAFTPSEEQRRTQAGRSEPQPEYR